MHLGLEAREDDDTWKRCFRGKKQEAARHRRETEAPRSSRVWLNICSNVITSFARLQGLFALGCCFPKRTRPSIDPADSHLFALFLVCGTLLYVLRVFTCGLFARSTGRWLILPECCSATLSKTFDPHVLWLPKLPLRRFSSQLGAVVSCWF